MKIGVFDSGLGGLTVLSQLMDHIPSADFVYFGDNARVPYGNKSEKMVKHFSLQAAHFLLSKNVDMIVVACNTASALALDLIKSSVKVPVIGMIQPAVDATATQSKNKKVLVIGTESTIASGTYQSRLIKRGISVSTKACPLFVPFVEAGITEHKALDLIIEEYLSDFKDEDTIILGCTHYPFLRASIEKHLKGKKIIDTGEAASKIISNQISENKTLIGTTDFYLSDKANNFINIAEEKLGLRINNLQQIDIEEW